MTAPGSVTRDLITPAQLSIIPASQASWADLQAVFGTADYPGMCYCQHYKTRDCHWSSLSGEERHRRLREQTRCDDPRAQTTSGLVAYLGQEPVGWVAVEPRTAYPRLPKVRTVWSGRQEDKTDDGVWAVTCFVTRKGYRKRGITYALAAATVGFAREGDHLGRAARRKPPGLRRRRLHRGESPQPAAGRDADGLRGLSGSTSGLAQAADSGSAVLRNR